MPPTLWPARRPDRRPWPRSSTRRCRRGSACTRRRRYNPGLSSGMADNKDVVRRYYDEVWGKGDPGAIDQFLADDYVDHNPPPGMAGDKASAGQIVAAITSDMSDINMDIRNVIGEGDYVAAHWLFEWTQR